MKNNMFSFGEDKNDKKDNIIKLSFLSFLSSPKKMSFIAVALICLLTGCEKPLPEDDSQFHAAADASPRLLLLNEGAWGNNNASLTLIDNSGGMLDNNWFDAANGRGMGDVAQDVIIYGSKAYATVTFSNSLEVIDTASGRSTRVDLGDRTPRYLAAMDGKLFITCYRPHSVVRLDTATLAVEAMCILGAYNPEGIAAMGGRLFVASSYVQTNNSSYRRDSLLYVVDPQAMHVDTTLIVGLNPQQVVDIDGRHLAVNYSGDYTDGTSGTAIVDATTLNVCQMGLTLTGMCAAGGMLYGFDRRGYSQESTATYYKVNPSTLATHTIHLSPHINTPYGMGIDPRNSDIYIFTDGNYTATGDILCYGADGTLRWRANAGMLPRKLVVL